MGYMIAKSNNQSVLNLNNVQQDKPVSFLAKTVKEEKTGNKKIEINERKFITEIKTDTLEKKFNELGKKIVAQDESLSANVSKLASLKKSKEG